MRFFEKIVYIKDTFWYIRNDRDCKLRISKLFFFPTGIIKEDIKDEDLYTFFDLSDLTNDVARYMVENHSEIRRMLDGSNEKYTFNAVSVCADGTIRLHFSEDGYYPIDSVPLNMSKCPGLYIETDDNARTAYSIVASLKRDPDDVFSVEEDFVFTTIDESEFDEVYRTIKTGKVDGKEVAFITEHN